MASNIVECDICGRKEPSEFLFWVDGDIDTDNQYKVSEFLTDQKADTCCEWCYEIILEKLDE
jgi:hypothetical protein